MMVIVTTIRPEQSKSVKAGAKPRKGKKQKPKSWGLGITVRLRRWGCQEDFFESAEQARRDVHIWEESRLQMKKILKQYTQASGPCKQSTFLQELIYPQNKFLRRFFLKLQHEQDSLFVEFVTLQTPKGVYITHIHFHPDLREIIGDDK